MIRPSLSLPIHRIEKNPAKIQAMYDLGVSDAKQALAALKSYLQAQ